MAKSRRGSPRAAVAGGQDGPLATKLFVPPRQTGFIPRPRLVEHLEQGLARPVILVCAPAGFGKTALLADWCRGSQRSSAWVSLDGGDNDAARFWRHLVASVDRVRPGISERLGALLGPPAPASFEGLAAALINELTSQAEEGADLLLVLDDYHVIESRTVHASIKFLIEHLPPALHLVLSSRADPPLPLARLRGGGQLAELRAAELRFTTEEAADLLREALGTNFPLPDSALQALIDRTEGWAVGLQLAALSVRGRPDLASFIEAFSGSHRYVLDYLTEEVLEHQPEQLRTFLLESSVLHRLSAALCDAVTGRTDSQSMLESIERANLFLVPLDDVRGWWRYHHLFADLLRARLERERPDRVQVLHRNAATWYEEHGLADDAVFHALATGDAALSASVIERHADRLLLLGEGATVERWLAALPDQLVQTRPRLLLSQVVLALQGGRLEGVDALLDAAERASASATRPRDAPRVDAPDAGLTNVSARIPHYRSFLAELRGDAEATIAFASQALAELGEGESMVASLIRGHLAVADWLRGRLPDAERELSSLIGEWQAAGQPFLAASRCDQLGLIRRAQGDLDAELDAYRQILAIAAVPGRPAVPAAGIPYVGMAQVAYQRDDRDTALRRVTEGIALCRQLAYTQPLATGLATLAWIRHAEGDPAGARQTMDEAAEVAPSHEVVDLLNPVPAGRARLLLVQGDVEAGAAWTAERALGPDDEPSYPREPAYLVLARVLLAQDRPEQAARLLDRLSAAAVAQGRIGSLIEIEALQALASAARGDEEGALGALAEAVALAHPHGWLRVLIDEGTASAALLGRLVAKRGRDLTARGVTLKYLSRLGAAIGPISTSTRSRSPVIPGLIEALSERELDVLRLLAAGKANREIAVELFVTVDTVKKHTTHILGKLGASNRTEAAARGRELGLIP